MTDLNTSVNNVLQAVLKTKKTAILLWKNHNPKLPNSFILKDREGKRYLGLSRTDKKGETYWSFKEISQKINQSNSSSPVMDQVAKFHQRQTKTQEINHGNNANSN